MQGKMKLAVRVAGIDGVQAFRGPLVASLNLGAYGLAAQRDFEGLEHLALAQQSHGALGFYDDDAVGLRYRCFAGGVQGRWAGHRHAGHDGREKRPSTLLHEFSVPGNLWDWQRA